MSHMEIFPDIYFCWHGLAVYLKAGLLFARETSYEN